MDIAQHIRIYELAPTDEFTDKRIAAIKQIRTAFGKVTSPIEMLRLASDLAQAAFATKPLREELQKLIFAPLKRQSSSLVINECATELCVCGLLAAGEMIEQASRSDDIGLADILALGLWLATDLIPAVENPKQDQLRLAIHKVARDRILATAQTSRTRVDVADLRIGDGAVSGEVLARTVSPILTALRDNAALDREELDLLWWLYAGRSELLGARLASLPPIVRAIATGLELGSMMRRVPSQAYRNLALREVDESIQVTLKELLVALADSREALFQSFADKSNMTEAPAVFPLLSSLHAGVALADLDNRARSLADWTARALLERAALQVQAIGARRK